MKTKLKEGGCLEGFQQRKWKWKLKQSEKMKLASSYVEVGQIYKVRKAGRLSTREPQQSSREGNLATAGEHQVC